jgi:replication-associated recombination protein RarA
MDLFGNESAAQNSLEFPEALTEKYRPRDLASFVGLDKPKKICAKIAEKPFSSAWLFIGPSGTGKTTMALALAAMIPAEIHHIPSQECNLVNIENVCATCHRVPWYGKRMHLVLVDEADQMTAAAQVSLLSKLDSTNFPPDTIFVFTANSSDRLEARFLSRLRVIEFSSYGIAQDAAAMLKAIWEREAPASASAPNFARIVKDSNNNVRESLMKLETELMLAC